MTDGQGSKERAAQLATLVDPSASALVIVDVQNDFAHPDGKSAALGADMTAAQRAVEQINRLIAYGHDTGMHIIYLRIEHSLLTDRPNYRARYRQRNLDPANLLCSAGSWGAAWYEGLLGPLPADAVITKYSYDGFQDTPLDAVLASRGVRNLIMSGLVTNLCVQTTAEHGFGLGYFLVVVTDATAGDDEAAHLSALRNLGSYFATLASADEIIATWQALAGHNTTLGGVS